MAKIYNIMNKLTNERPIIKIDDTHEYKINNTKNNAIYIQSLSKKAEKGEMDDIELLDKIIKASLGQDAFDYIESLGLDLESYGIIVNTIMAAISNLELEEVEAINEEETNRFQKDK
ncbi:hypothetical protein [Paraclostridium sordellii]|uniref:hypothetical protein n=1 Tax=Paraclostridium sordellii TaxID=1505 RepID=UPI0005E3BCD3|nr:hypothetical protein [Paeniclostridium sordellii]CEQ27119.1 Uncharacterised protein [[Clostridium] sordellii] [Paeniclostridium sordellii]